MTVHPRAAAVLSAAALVVAAGSAFAQVTEPPPRVTRPRFGGGPPMDPNRVRHDLTFDAYLMGGYEDNIAGLLAPPIGLDPRPSATMTSGSGGLRYFVGTPEKGVDVSGQGVVSYASTYRQAGLSPKYAGNVSFGARTDLGRRTKLYASQGLQVSPYASLGLFGGLGGGLNGGLPAGARGGARGGVLGNLVTGADARLANGLFEGLTWGWNTSASLDREWTRRTSTTFVYGFDRQVHEDRTLLDNNSHRGSLFLRRQVGRTGSMRAGYTATVADSFQRGRAAYRVMQTLDGGFSWSHDISRTRTLFLAGGGGASYTDRRDQVRQKYWLPIAYASAMVDVGRSWTLSADWRQSTNVIPSPLFAPNTFLSNTVNVRLGGYVTQRVELAFDVANSNGIVPARANEGDGSYKGYTGNAQVRVALTRWWTALAQLNHYRASLDGEAAAAFGASANFHRNSIMVGFGWSLPLLDAAGRGARRAGGGR